MMQRCSLFSCGSVHEADGSPHPSNLALALDAGDTKDDDVHPSFVLVFESRALRIPE